MLNETIVEQRLATLEQAVADLQRRLADFRGTGNWLATLTGSISDPAAFDEVLEFGRAFRKSSQPPDDLDTSA
jgi:hypothetical protein